MSLELKLSGKTAIVTGGSAGIGLAIAKALYSEGVNVAIADYGDQPRHVQRVTIVGDLPVGIDGKQSEAIKGDASGYNRREAVTA
ncbi:SDR family NAD(P)-dependent oxidoreductase [Nostoc sp.]|uniref:SDR family NAD(P)-dependent oxidoreductase n=1 Tax=Nostoc sp. TaxID=1180 RepID=UPI002FF95339